MRRGWFRRVPARPSEPTRRLFFWPRERWLAGGFLGSSLPVLSRADRAMTHLSNVLFVAMHLACLFVLVVPFSLKLLGLAAFGYVLRMWAITAGYHRYFAHRSFKTSRAFQFVLAFLGTTAMQNGPLWWASWHRRHHKYSDTPEDAHSPRHGGFWHAHVGWFLDGSHDRPDMSNVKDLARYPELRFLERHKWMPIVTYAVVCFAVAGWGGLVWGFVVSTITVLHATALINSLAHVWGSRRFETNDDSRNNALLAVLTLGEGWHNNHHDQMGSARQGVRWWELDVSYYSLRALALVGVVWSIRERRPPRDVTASRPRPLPAAQPLPLPLPLPLAPASPVPVAAAAE
jgi:stearoyl-CoA desaturase (Delta-9 desaturase)